MKGRSRTPPPMRYLLPPFGFEPLKYLLDVGFTRDVWAHRIDIYQVIGRPMQGPICRMSGFVPDV